MDIAGCCPENSQQAGGRFDDVDDVLQSAAALCSSLLACILLFTV